MRSIFVFLLVLFANCSCCSCTTMKKTQTEERDLSSYSNRVSKDLVSHTPSNLGPVDLLEENISRVLEKSCDSHLFLLVTSHCLENITQEVRKVFPGWNPYDLHQTAEWKKTADMVVHAFQKALSREKFGNAILVTREEGFPFISLFSPGNMVDSELLFGKDNLISMYAAKGYKFWKKGEKTPLSDTKDDQKTRRTAFQKALGAWYITPADINEEGKVELTGLEAPSLKELTPHVVIKTVQIKNDAITRKLTLFFLSANTQARGGTPIPAEETIAQRDERIQLERNTNAVAVIDAQVTKRGFLLDFYDSHPEFFKAIRRLIVTTTSSNIKVIGEFFLCSYSGLTHIDLNSFLHVEAIESGFLYGCSGLTKIDLSPLSHVRTIGRYFLNFCPNLSELRKNIAAQYDGGEKTIREKRAAQLRNYIATLGHAKSSAAAFTGELV